LAEREREAIAMDRNELLAEITRVNRLLATAKKGAIVQYALIDKLTAASLHVQVLLRKLRGVSTSGTALRSRGASSRTPRPAADAAKPPR
jgi:hypothetical protein